MSYMTDCLVEFIQKFGGSLDPRLWVSLIEEETAEWVEAHTTFMLSEVPDGEDLGRKAHLLKETADLAYVLTGFNILMETGENLYLFLIGPEEEARWSLAVLEANRAMRTAQGIFGPNVMVEAFSRVHQSNLSKLGDDGKPIRRKDGKILKGPNYKVPDLSDLV